MQDVAELAGVSRSLVSLVFQDAPNVSESRRAAVHEAAESLGFRPNRVARNLARGRTMTVGVVVDDLQNPFFARTVEGIEEPIEAAGYHVLVANGARDADRTSEAVATFVDLRTDGVIAIGARDEEMLFNAVGAATPLVLVASRSELSAIDSVNTDDIAGSELAVAHLVNHGHERIVHVDGGSGASAAARRRGYESAMDAHGLGAHIDVVDADFTHEAGQRAARTLAEREVLPTAIFAGNDMNALGLWSELNRLGVAVPQDISIVGYDDTMLVNLGIQGLTTVRQPAFEMGVQAAKRLIARIEGEAKGASSDVLAPSLVVRSSTMPVDG